MLKPETSKKLIFPVFLTVLIDMLGLGIIIPILPQLLLDPKFGILASEADSSVRNIVYGFLVASFPLMQFFGAPVLGALSDKFGRRRILLISLAGTFFGYLLFAYGIHAKAILILFFARALDGFTGGNISTAMSVISDISPPEKKARNFGMIGAAFGIGFVIGPYVGGALSDPSRVSWFSATTPLLFAALLSFINILLVFFRLPETLKNPQQTRVSILTGFRNLGKAFSNPDTRTVFIAVFFLALGFTFFTQFFQVYLYHKFAYNASQTGDVLAYIGIWIIIAQGGLMRPLSKKFKAWQIMRVSPFILAFALLAILWPDKPTLLFFVLPFVSLSQGVTQPNINTVVSNQVSPDRQGEILGINQSVQSFAMAIPPIAAAYLTNINIDLPTIAAASFVFLAWLIFVIFYKARV